MPPIPLWLVLSQVGQLRWLTGVVRAPPQLGWGSDFPVDAGPVHPHWKLLWNGSISPLSLQVLALMMVMRRMTMRTRTMMTTMSDFYGGALCSPSLAAASDLRLRLLALSLQPFPSPNLLPPQRLRLLQNLLASRKPWPGHWLSCQGYSVGKPNQGWNRLDLLRPGRLEIFPPSPARNRSFLWPSSCGTLPPKVLLLCRSWGACVPCRSQRLCQLEFWLLVGTTMLDRLWARGQTKCNTLLMLATSVFGRILLTTLLCDVLVEVQAGHLMAQWRGMQGVMSGAICHADTHYPAR